MVKTNAPISKETETEERKTERKAKIYLLISMFSINFMTSSEMWTVVIVLQPLYRYIPRSIGAK